MHAQHALSLDDVRSARFNAGTALRIIADIGAIWLSFLAASLLIDERASWTTQEWVRIAAVVVLFSALVIIAYAGAGLYTHAHRLTLPAKLLRVAGINLGLFAAGGAILSVTYDAIAMIAAITAVWMTGPLPQCKGDVEKLLKVPPDMDIVALIPVGYPAESPTKDRKPVREVCEIIH